MRIGIKCVSLVAVTVALTTGCGNSSSSSGGGGGSTATLGATINAVVAAQAAIVAGASCENWSPGMLAYRTANGARMATTYQAEVDAGRIPFNKTAADSCLAAVQSQTCATARTGIPAICNSALTGTVAPGGACTVDDSCGTGWCNAGTTCPGICVAGLANAAVCTSGYQCTSKYCASGHCAAALATGATNGAACGTGPNNECAAGLTCANGTTCSPVQSAGGTCNSDSDCAPSLNCNYNGTCATAVAMGATCSLSLPCPFGAYCSPAGGTKCVEVPATAGASCAETAYCMSDTLNCVSNVCTTITLNACWMI